jgi:co-chaperonin GroES (HSP10)
MEKEYGKPLGDRVLIKMVDGSDKTPSGLILRTGDDTVKRATVVNVSDGYVSSTGKWIHLQVQLDDTVLVPAGINSIKIRVEGETLHLVRESDILMVL